MNKTTLLAAFAACLLAGCGGEGEGEPEPSAPQDPVVARMHDAEYVKKLESQIDARKDILREVAEAKRRLAAAEAAGAAGEELAALSNAVKAAARKFEKNRAESIVLVGQQMQKDRAANLEKLQQKGK